MICSAPANTFLTGGVRVKGLSPPAASSRVKGALMPWPVLVMRILVWGGMVYP